MAADPLNIVTSPVTQGNAEPLADTRFYLYGESPSVGNALTQYLTGRGSQVIPVSRLGEIAPAEEFDNVVLVHISAEQGLARRLLELKTAFPAARILLLHEFSDRGKIDADILASADQLLEKPFTRANLEKALTRFRFHPLTGRTVYLCGGENETEEGTLKRLGLTVLRRLPENAGRVAFDLGVFSPGALDENFRSALKTFRAAYADVPVFLLYDPQVPGVLDSAVLNEVAYLVQRPVRRDVLRQKLIAYFEQPQQDRRKNPRKQGISQLWISAYNTELGTTELFESPFLIDISRSGLSFQSHVEYPEQQLMAVWIVSEDYPDRIIDLRGHIRWRRQDATSEAAGAQLYKYGVEFTADESEGFLNFAKMIAMHSG